MPESAFACPKCKTAFSVEPGTVDLSADCPTCDSTLHAHFFPAFFRPIEIGMAASALIDQTEASCFYHPQKQAVRVCDGCGRLICNLCSVDLGTEHMCPTCISAGRKKGKFSNLETGRIRYDSIALSLAVFGLFTSFLSVVLAPMAIYFAIRHWNAPAGVLGGGRRRLVIAIVIAALSLLLWGGLLVLAIFGASRLPHHHHA